MDSTACKAKAPEEIFWGFFLVRPYGEMEISTLKVNGSAI
jgi:hypothetical protein